jgi:hypothetical protein
MEAQRTRISAAQKLCQQYVCEDDMIDDNFFLSIKYFPRINAFSIQLCVNPLTPELNPSAQGCMMRFFTGNFAS